ncbi:MAG: hypothetical protein Q8O67_08765 [Deltaproteobacteria bacterium]|nr:hypothetical protein [Deltaproteobacteria bacterium]
MARSWLVLPGPSRAYAARLAGLSQAVDVAALDLPIALPVAVDAFGALHQAARGIEAARIIDETPLAAASANRIAATRVVVDGDILVIYGGRNVLRLRPDDIEGVFAVRTYTGPAIVLMRAADAGAVVIARDTDLADILPGTTADEAFARFAAGVSGIVGKPVDATLLGPGVASALRLVDDVVDILDLGRLARAAPPLGPPPDVIALAPNPVVTAPLGPNGQPVALNGSCQTCSAPVVLADAFYVAAEPMCGTCVQKFTAGGRERRAVFSGAVFLSVSALFFLTSSFDVVGRALGTMFLLAVTHTILRTGVQYDVDVDRGVGRQRTRVRTSGFFKMWGDLIALKLGRVVQAGLYLIIAVGAWLLPVNKGLSAGRIDETYVDDDGSARYTSITLVPLAGSAERAGLRLELVEIRSDAGLTFTVEATRGAAQQKLQFHPVDVGKRLETFGVRWQIISFTAAPRPPSLTITFDNIRFE